MGTRADFYVEKYDRLMWVGSLFKNGEPTKIPTEILIQVNASMYEELVVELLEEKDSAIRSNGDLWPWPWEDSRMTDYVYIFQGGNVVAYSRTTGKVFDPVKIKQGDDIKTAEYPFDIIFPLMNKQSKIVMEDLLNNYGFKPAKAV